jgi:xanthine dehydrogenase YagT iron-sulfur-binding subunit
LRNDGADNKGEPGSELTRRRFLKTAGVGVAVLGAIGGWSLRSSKQATADAAPKAAPAKGPRQPIQRTITLHVNNRDYHVIVDTRETLAEAIRDKVGLTGTKVGCNHGQCGACTVILGGQAVYSCSTLAVQAEGAKITTIEGLSQGEKLHPVQEAFLAHDAFQCGICTSGQIMALTACLNNAPGKVTEESIKAGMGGNLCRCGAYVQIIRAGLQAAAAMGKS